MRPTAVRGVCSFEKLYKRQASGGRLNRDATMWSALSARAASLMSRQTAQWREEKRHWQRALLRCPIASHHGDVARERRAALRARAAVACACAVFTSYVFLDQMIKSRGIPYYFIWLTNWTGVVTNLYSILAAKAAWDAHRQREGDSPSSPSPYLSHTSQSPRRPTSPASRAEPSPIPAAEEEPPMPTPTPTPRYVHVLWSVKATAPIAQVLITLMYWGILYRPQYGPLTGDKFIAHGGFSLVLILDHLFLNRLTLGNIYDVLHTYAFGAVYLLFNVVYTVVFTRCCGATDHDGKPYVYEILAWRTHSARAGIVVSAVFVIVLPLCWGVMCAVTALRDRKLFPPPPDEAEDEEADLEEREGTTFGTSTRE